MKGLGYAALLACAMMLLPRNVFALARWECRGLTADKIVLTPYQDGTVNLSFDDGPVRETTKWTHKGDVFTAIFQRVSGVNGAMLGYIIDAITRNGYEFFQKNDGQSGAAKMTCWYYQN